VIGLGWLPDRSADALADRCIKLGEWLGVGRSGGTGLGEGDGCVPCFEGEFDEETVGGGVTEGDGA
jgi:hypothetical protein